MYSHGGHTYLFEKICENRFIWLCDNRGQGCNGQIHTTADIPWTFLETIAPHNCTETAIIDEGHRFKTRSRLDCAIFPDEIDEDVWNGVTTRSGKTTGSILNLCDLDDDDEPTFTSSRNKSRRFYKSLAAWKTNSGLFEACTSSQCDPFKQFLKHQSRVCCFCHEIRHRLREKMILAWEPKELMVNLFNYAHFHTIKIFDPEADQRYLAAKSQNPYFLSYTQLRRTNEQILARIAATFNFSPYLMSIVRRPFMTHKAVGGTQEIVDLGISAKCQICQKSTSNFTNYQIFTLSGRSYLANFEVRGMDEDEPEPEHILLCLLHSRVFTAFYHLRHMDWNVHWNCHLRVSHCLLAMPDSDAAQIIEAINPKIYKLLALFYRTWYMHLEQLSSFKQSSDRFTEADTWGYENWMRVKREIKNEALFVRSLRFDGG